MGFLMVRRDKLHNTDMFFSCALNRFCHHLEAGTVFESIYDIEVIVKYFRIVDFEIQSQ